MRSDTILNRENNKYTICILISISISAANEFHLKMSSCICSPLFDVPPCSFSENLQIKHIGKKHTHTATEHQHKIITDNPNNTPCKSSSMRHYWYMCQLAYRSMDFSAGTEKVLLVKLVNQLICAQNNTCRSTCKQLPSKIHITKCLNPKRLENSRFYCDTDHFISLYLPFMENLNTEKVLEEHSLKKCLGHKYKHTHVYIYSNIYKYVFYKYNLFYM